MVLRVQVFAGDALTHLAFTGATAAAAVGADLRLGALGATVAGAVAIEILGGRSGSDDATTGIGLAWFLGLGVFLLSIAGGADGQLAARTLFGSIFGLSGGEATVAAVLGLAVLVAMLLVARPLLFATLAPVTAAARGVPVRALGLVLLVLLGATVAEATTAIGALLLLGLLCAPAAAAQLMTSRPYRALALSAALAVGATWAGVLFADAVPAVPPSTAVVGFAAATLAAATLLRRSRPRPRLAP